MAFLYNVFYHCMTFQVNSFYGLADMALTESLQTDGQSDSSVLPQTSCGGGIRRQYTIVNKQQSILE